MSLQEKDPDPQREEVLVKTEAQVGVMWPQVKDTWSPSNLEEARKVSLSEISEGACPGNTLVLDFWFPEL